MFTGIIQDVGEIAEVVKQGDWVVTIGSKKLPLDHMSRGASIACGGICLTMIEKTVHQFKVQISQETLSKTTAIHWHHGSRINLEPALRAGDEFGGHILSGHVDGLARVVDRGVVGDSLRYEFEVPKGFAKYIVPKGSIALDGISLTVNDVDGVRFGVNIIPYTQKETTIGALAIGDEVNFEIDMIARYVERMLKEKAV